jgi:hypothetical protein
VRERHNSVRKATKATRSLWNRPRERERERKKEPSVGLRV